MRRSLVAACSTAAAAAAAVILMLPPSASAAAHAAVVTRTAVSSAQTAAHHRSHGLKITIVGGKVTALGGRVVGSVAYGPGVRKTTIRSNPSYGSDWICYVYSNNPVKSGNDITVHASQNCTGSGFDPIDICDTLQWLRWFGWQNISGPRCSGYAYVASDSVTTTPFNCAGTGTHNYNGAANGYAEGGLYGSGEVDSSSQPRWNCG